MDFVPVLLAAAETAGAASAAPPLAMDLRISLSVMNFLEFAVWGAWFVVLGQYLNTLNFNSRWIGSIYATMSLGTIISPIFVGVFADSVMPAQYVLAILHLVGAGLLYAMSQIKTPGKFFIVALLYAMAYSPTIALARAVMNSGVPDIGRDAPTLRVWGTIGWIVANLALKLLLETGKPVNNRPLLLAALLSLIFGVFAFTLPASKAQGDAPLWEALNLLTDPKFGVFFIVSFLITIALAFYYSFTSLFLEQKVKVRSDLVGPLMTIGQFMEIGFMLLLPAVLAAIGIKWVLVIGMGAWVVRYALFSTGGPFPLILVGLALHGICYDFFFEAGFIYVGQNVPAGIQASANSLFVTLTYGIGMYLGTELSGWANFFCSTTTTDPATGTVTRHVNWSKFWMMPCIGALVCLIAFLVLAR